jgi:hypothetical protein
MVSAWKIRRELDRLRQQLQGIMDLVTDPIAQRQLERVLAAGLPSTVGALKMGPKIALFLIYQPKGLSESTLETCRFLKRAGYIPFVVSNAPLTRQDRIRLQPCVWRIIERPNFGYDFGGYRDGLTYLRQCGLTPAELLILNDSVWFPTITETDILVKLAASPADIAGPILRVRGSERFLESYLFRLRRSALEHPAFSDFWANLKLTSNKYYVIRRGERGFSAAMRGAGLQVEGVYDKATFVEDIAIQDETFLRSTLKYGAYIDADLVKESANLLQENHTGWREDAIVHIRKVLEKRQVYSSFPYANVQLTGYPLLKKSTEPVSKAWRLAYLKAVEAEEVPAPSDQVLAEIRSHDLGRRHSQR